MNKLIQYVLPSLVLGFLVGWAGHIFLQETNHNHSEMDQETSVQAEAAIYTCSMHPQIRQPEPGLCPICEMDLILLDASTSDDPLVLEMTESAIQLANIQTVPVRAGSASGKQTLRLSGRVAADERRRSSQVTHLPGRIEQLYVRFTGAPITEGQALAEIYAPDLITAQRELLEARKMVPQNPELLSAARQKLRYWKLTEAQITDLERSETIQETLTVYAASSGVVEKLRVATGDYVQQGDVLFDVLDLSSVWVLFDAYEADLSRFRTGDRIEFSSPTFPDRSYSGLISFIDPVIDPNTRVASLRVAIANPAGDLKPGMLVRGLWEKTASAATLQVPRSAVLWTGTRSVVYVRVPDSEVPAFQYREITLGEQIGDFYEVVAGLTSGEEVVVNGAFTIDAAAQLNNQASMMNRKVQRKGQEIAADYQAITPIAFKASLDQLVGAYLSVKDALVQTDSQSASEAGLVLQQTLAALAADELPDEARFFWDKKSAALATHLERFSEATGITEQREQFGFFSALLIQVVTAMGHEQGTYYVQHCPMAFNDEGGDWLSAEADIKNPYFGDRMLKCGLVEQVLE